MNILLLTPQDFQPDGLAVVSGRRFEQLTGVIGVAPGKICKAGVLGGDRGTGEVVAVDDKVVTIRFTAQRPAPPKIGVTLIAALPRPNTFVKILHCATAMGVDEIRFIQTFKVEKSYWQSPKISPETAEKEVILALEQSGDTVMPKLFFHRDFREFINHDLPGIAAGAPSYIGSPSAVLTASKLDAPYINLAIGPEGGFTETEEKLFQQNGFTPVSLGSRTLRSEFAVAALLAKLR